MSRLFPALSSLTRVYLLSASVIFAFAGFSKLLWPSISESDQRRDRVLTFLTQRQLERAVILIEVATAGLIVVTLKRSPHPGLAFSVFLAGSIVLYRISLRFAAQGDGGCGCFGNLGGFIGKRAEQLAPVLLTYLFLLGVGLSIMHLLYPRQSVTTKA